MKTRLHPLLIVLLGSLLFLSSCKKEASQEATEAFNSVIPKPLTVDISTGAFILNSNASIGIKPDNEKTRAVANYLAGLLKPATGFDLEIQSEETKANIVLELSSDESAFGPEGYRLTVTDDQIVIRSLEPNGLFYGVQTLRQIMPPAIESGSVQNIAWEVATGEITDRPVYSWRGTMLDVARHFFGMDEVKRFIDYNAMYKLNKVHLHLTDDQGWRIEIKSWPNLTAHGGKTEVGGGKGGFFTQEQYAELVNYAQARFITIIPEIDMPGHINSALASYGELNGGTVVPEEGRYKVVDTNPVLDGKLKPTDLYIGTSVGWSTLRYEKESTMRFITDVIREISAITPGPWIHIGGDEAHVTKKSDYIAFVNKFTELAKANGKIMIGWEEIAQGDIDSTSISQHWHEPNYARMASEKGAKIIMSPSTKIYLDMQYDSTSRIGLHWAAYVEADDAYNWDIATHVEGVDEEAILGIEGPLWGETIDNMEDIEYLLFPRITAVAELGWTPAEGRSWESYSYRTGRQASRWKSLGIDYYPSVKIPWK